MSCISTHVYKVLASKKLLQNQKDACTVTNKKRFVMHHPNFKEIHIENTNSCGYKCTMCPREKLTRNLGFMSLDDFGLVLEKVNPFEGIFHLHGFGEPLLDRQLSNKIKLLKEKIPTSNACIFSTLGVRVKNDYFLQLIESGLDVIVVSLYGLDQASYKKIHGYDGFELVKHNLELLSSAKHEAQKKISVYIKIPGITQIELLDIQKSIASELFSSWMRNLGFDIGYWNKLHNFGDGRHYNEPEKKMCPVINGLRKEILNINWNLDVIPCCYDFNATIKFGNLRTQSLNEIFSSKEYFKFILAHKTEQLQAYPVCSNCEKLDIN